MSANLLFCGVLLAVVAVSVAAGPAAWRLDGKAIAPAAGARATEGPGGLPGVYIAPSAGAPQAGTASLPASALGARGTLSLWLRLDREVRTGTAEFPILRSGAVTLLVGERRWGTALSAGFGPAMRSVEEKESKVGLGQALLTHLDAARWYHVALAWDAGRQEARLFLNGVPLNDFDAPPFSAARGGEIPAQLGAPGVAVAGLEVRPTECDAEALAALVRERTGAPMPALGDEGPRRFDETLRVEDVPGRRELYHTDFADAAALKDWTLEGRGTAKVEEGVLVVRSDPGGPDGVAGNHLVNWLRRDVPADFLAAWSFQPKDPQKGLAIVFFNARGRKGEDIFDPSLPPRDGNFALYHTGALDCYHISYWAGNRGTANLRKNYGFFLAAIGDDAISRMQPGEWARVVLLKQGGKVRLSVNGRVCLAFDDDGRTYGPVHSHPGKIGLRQMSHSEECRYRDFTVWGLE